jgi:hypothetical protein
MKYFKSLMLATVLSASSVQAAERARDQAAPAPVPEKPVEITVYRSPTCGCCGKWLEHMKKNGFTVKDIKTEEMDKIKQQYGVPKNLQSCHTGVVEGYVIEGHVPAADVRDLLKKHPDAAGLSVPGMTVGTPGMEMGGKKDPFDVVEFDKQGHARTFHEYRAY